MATKQIKVTPYQERVYALLLQIPSGKISSYASLSKVLGSSPRAVGGALRNNPFAPEVPCHRVISASGVSLYIHLRIYAAVYVCFVVLKNGYMN